MYRLILSGVKQNPSTLSSTLGTALGIIPAHGRGCVGQGRVEMDTRSEAESLLSYPRRCLI